MTIFTLGCSFTAKYQVDVDPWPEVLKRKTGLEVINLGRDGSGNKYAFDTLLSVIRRGSKIETVYWLMSEFTRYDTVEGVTFRGNDFNVEGQTKQDYISRWIKRDEERNLTYSGKWNPEEKEKRFQIRSEGLKRALDLGEIMYNIISPKDFIDSNLMLIHLMQKICKAYNIELKIACALRPLYTHDPEQISLMLKSEYVKKLDFTNILGYPFFGQAGGMCVIDIKNWGEKYGISPTDCHPNQAGSDLIADFFLGEKNILDYR